MSFMFDIECPLPVRKKIESSGLVKRINQTEEKWKEALSYGGIEWAFDDVFEVAEKYLKTIDFSSKKTAKEDLCKDILDLRYAIDEDAFPLIGGEKEIQRNPSAFAYLILGDKLLHPEKYGFHSRRQLEESLLSYCVMKDLMTIRSDDYIWVHNGRQNTLSNSHHGDFYIGQVDVSGDYRKENTFFGEIEIFDTMKDIKNARKGISVHDGFLGWDRWLSIVLKYADVIGKGGSKEIKQWQQAMEQVGVIGTNTAEALCGTDFGALDASNMTHPIIIDGKELDMAPMSLPVSGMHDTTYYLPFVKDGKLLLIRKSKAGNIHLSKQDNGFFKGQRFKEYMTFEEQDLPDMLKGTYRLFARDRRRLPKIMKLHEMGFPEDYHKAFKRLEKR